MDEREGYNLEKGQGESYVKKKKKDRILPSGGSKRVIRGKGRT